ncbi:MAG: murein biosynthesis integral membrane protein MurJ [Bdellovibrionaceae bacterium]|nr:murein biosynthesis integral membrane protein MurJ [Pseudobdellovibrionaceae bacterium]|tara:strand:- start:7769 stop:9328 length:1560 start_codon:yes stop_codon:yes gene_type:complete
MAQSSSPKLKHGKSSFGAAAVAMSAGTLLSRILGFVRDAVLLGVFDRTLTDAFVVGFRLPNLFRRLFGEGALSVSFIPIYLESLKKDPEAAKALASTVFTVLLTLTTTLFALGYLFMPQIMNAWVSDPQGYAAIPGKMELTIQLARIMLAYLILVTSYAFGMAISNALGYFFLPAMAPALFNLLVIIFSFLPFFQFQGDQLAWGVIAGGVAQWALVFFMLAKVHAFPAFRWDVGSPLFKRVLKNMAPGVFGLGVFQVMTLVNTSFAARLKEGAQSYIYSADRILELPQSLIAISLGAALLPRFSNYLTDGRKDLMLGEAHRAMRALLFLAIPSALGMYLLNTEITDLLFGRGNFDANDILQTGQVVAIYSALLVATSISKVLSPGFYAMNDTKTPAVIAFFALIIHILMGNFLVDEYGLPGLAFATTVSSALNMSLLNLQFRRKLGSLRWLEILKAFFRWIPGLALMTALCIYLPRQLSPFVGASLSTALVIALSVVGYFYLAHLFHAPEIQAIRRRRK